MNIEQEMIAMGDKEKARASSRFFKSGPGEYSEGDVFLGIRVPDIRVYAKTKLHISFSEIELLLNSQYHEVRMCACMILRMRVHENPSKILKLYMKHVGIGKGINNWDLVDETSCDIVGFAISPPFMENKKRLGFIEKCINSTDLWVNRVIIVATHFQLKQGNEKMLLYSAPRFLSHKHDLIHKAVGWMLREMGARCGHVILSSFIETYGKKMPRTMLRYAIEHFDAKERKHILLITK